MDLNPLSDLDQEDPASGEWKRTSPLVIPLFVVQRLKSIAGNFVSLFLNVAGPAAPVFLALGDLGVSWTWRILISIACSFLFQIGVAICTYWTFKYRVNPSTVSVKSGILQKQQTDVPWYQIRAANVTRGPIDRVLRLARVSFDTAGSQNVEIEIPGLRIVLAEEIVEKVEKVRSETKGNAPTTSEYTQPTEIFEEDTRADEKFETLFELSRSDLWKSTLCIGGEIGAIIKGFLSLAILYVLFRWAYREFFEDESDGLLQFIIGWAIDGKAIDGGAIDLPQDFLIDVMRLPELVDTVLGSQFAGSEVGLSVFFTLSTLIVALFFVVVSRWRFYKANFGLVLRHDDTRLVLESGLFSKRRVTIVKDRIQEITYQRILRERLLRRGKLSVKQSESGTDHMLSVPYVTARTVDDIVQVVYGSEQLDTSLDPSAEEFRRISKVDLYVDLATQICVGLPVLLVVLATLVPVLRQFMWPYALLGPILIAIGNWLSWSKQGYVFRDSHLTRRTGMLGYSVRNVRLEKIQHVKIERSPIQRLRDTCDLEVKYESGSIRIPYLKLDVARSMRAQALHVVQHEVVKWT